MREITDATKQSVLSWSKSQSPELADTIQRNIGSLSEKAALFGRIHNIDVNKFITDNLPKKGGSRRKRRRRRTRYAKRF